MLKNILNNKRAYTLAEMVLVLFLFSLIAVGITIIFSQFLNGEKKAFNKQKVSADLRYSMELMAREIRMNTIDYRVSGYYSGTVPLPTSELALLDSDDNQTIFALSGSNCETTDGCYLYVRRNGTNYRISPDDVSVKKLEFYISPSQDPFNAQSDGTFQADKQPRVLIILTEEVTGYPESKNTIQTAVSSKLYKR